jgi:hypothetical protein
MADLTALHHESRLVAPWMKARSTTDLSAWFAVKMWLHRDAKSMAP